MEHPPLKGDQDNTNLMADGIIFTTTTPCSVCVSLLVFPPTLHAAAPLQIPLLPQLHTTHNIHPAQFVVLRFN